MGGPQGVALLTVDHSAAMRLSLVSRGPLCEETAETTRMIGAADREMDCSATSPKPGLHHGEDVECRVRRALIDSAT